MLRRITVAYTINELGNSLGAVAIAVAVYDHTHSAAATAALFVAIYFLPALFATLVVAWLESLARRGIQAGLYVAQAATTGGLAALVVHPVLAPILVLAAIDGLGAVASRALLRAVVSQQAGGSEARVRANGRLNIGWAAGSAIGPVIGGALTGFIGASLVLVIDVASFALTAILMADVPTPRTDAARGRVLAQLRAVRQYVKRTPSLAWLLGTEALALVFFASAVPVTVVLVKATLNGTDAGYGAVVTAWGAGMFLGSGIFARARERSLGLLLTLSTLAVAVAYLGMGTSNALWVAAVFSFIGGTGNGVQWIALITSVQEKTVSHMQGRVMGVLESVASLCLGIGFALGGAVAAVFDNARVTFWMAGAAALVATLAFVRVAVRTGGAPGEQLQADPEPSA
jgi:MFS family permease